MIVNVVGILFLVFMGFEQDLFTIEHKQYETEQFRVASAEYNFHPIEGTSLIEFTISIEFSEAIHRDSELKEVFNALPYIEATALIDTSDFRLVTGAQFTQHAGYDYQREVNLSDFYYIGHNSIEELVIEIQEFDQSSIRASVSGESVVNSESLEERDVRLQLTTTFKRNHELFRGAE